MMPESARERIAALRAAAKAQRWEEFSRLIRSWAEGNPSAPLLRAGRVVAEAARGGQVTADDILGLKALDQRLLNQIEALASLRAGNHEEARQRVVREIAWGGWEPAWAEALAYLDEGTRDPVKYLFATPHLVVGCILRHGEVTAMAAKGSRMSADSLGHRADLVWAETSRLNERLGIGAVTAIHVTGEDGGWVLVSTGGESPDMATALVAAPPMTDEAAARARMVVAALEAADD